jgi:hypothetical protein
MTRYLFISRQHRSVPSRMALFTSPATYLSDRTPRHVIDGCRR